MRKANRGKMERMKALSKHSGRVYRLAEQGRTVDIGSSLAQEIQCVFDHLA